MSAPSAEWRRETLLEVSRGGFMRDGDWVESKDQDPVGVVRLTQLADVGVGEFRNRSDRWMRPDQADRLRCTFLEPADILIARMPDPIGRACLAPETIGNAVTAVDVSILRIRRADVDPRFVMWAVNSPQFNQTVVARQSGTTRKRISRKNLEALAIPVPPIRVQRRIIEILEEHLSHLDAAQVSLDAAYRRCEPLITAVLQELVPLASADGWSLITVQQAGDLKLGRQRHPDWHVGPNMKPYLRVANVFEDRLDLSDVKEMDFTGVFDRFRLEPGDVLLNEGQSPEFLGRPAIYRGDPPEIAFTNTLIRFRGSSKVLPEWALLVFRRHMRSGRFIKESRITTNIAHLSMKRLASVEFPLPPLEQQERLVKRADALLGHADRLRVEVTARKLQVATLRRSLLAAAFSGRLTGRASDTDLIQDLASA